MSLSNYTPLRGQHEKRDNEYQVKFNFPRFTLYPRKTSNNSRKRVEHKKTWIIKIFVTLIQKGPIVVRIESNIARGF